MVSSITAFAANVTAKNDASLTQDSGQL